MITTKRVMTSTNEPRVHMLADDSNATRDGAAEVECAIATEHSALHALQMAFVQLLADTMTIRDLYAKHALQASGPHARLFELICQRHHVEHVRLAELLAGQVRTLGGDALVMAGDIAAHSSIPRPPRRAESLDVQVHRLVSAHEVIALRAIAMLTKSESESRGGRLSHEAVLVTSELVLTGKLHLWLLAEHLQHVSDASQTFFDTPSFAGRLVLPFC